MMWPFTGRGKLAACEGQLEHVAAGLAVRGQKADMGPRPVPAAGEVREAEPRRRAGHLLKEEDRLRLCHFGRGGLRLLLMRHAPRRCPLELAVAPHTASHRSWTSIRPSTGAWNRR
jgi:hypothetical protein